MSRRKLWYSSWTIVFVLTFLIPCAISRPSVDTQPEVTTTSKNHINNLTKPPENAIRYKDNNYIDVNDKYVRISALDRNTKLEVNKIHKRRTRDTRAIRLNKEFFFLSNSKNGRSDRGINLVESRNARHSLSSSKVSKTRIGIIDVPGNNIVKTVLEWQIKPGIAKFNKSDVNSSEDEGFSDRKPIIRKVLTKWTDRAKFGELTTAGHGSDGYTNSFQNSVGDYSTEHELDLTTEKDFFNVRTPSTPTQTYNKLIRPYQNSEEIHVYSNNLHVLDNYNGHRRPIEFNTPSPTPIITNVGMPKPWYHIPPYTSDSSNTMGQHSLPIKPPKKPQNNYDTHTTPYPHSQNSYRPNQFVTSSEPVTSYTDKIIIKPEEYNASPNECPTIYLTLNNTFQAAQGKEACPDLNIAINTNLVNKNVVVSESEEDASVTNGSFGIPLEDAESESAEPYTPPDYYDSESNENINAHGIEEHPEDYHQFTAYNTELTQENNQNTDAVAASSGGHQSLTRPGRPNRRPHRRPYRRPHKPNKDKDKDKDKDDYGLGSYNDWVKPAVSIMSWVATFNPFNFGILSMILTPIALILAGSSGVAALFAPWALPYARQSPKVVHEHRPQWEWDQIEHTWSYNAFPDNRMRIIDQRSEEDLKSNESNKTKKEMAENFKSWLYDKLVKTLKSVNHNVMAFQRLRDNKRLKINLWKVSIK